MQPEEETSEVEEKTETTTESPPTIGDTGIPVTDEAPITPEELTAAATKVTQDGNDFEKA